MIATYTIVFNTLSLKVYASLRSVQIKGPPDLLHPRSNGH